MTNSEWGFTIGWNLTIVCSPLLPETPKLSFHKCTSSRSICEVRFTRSPIFVSISYTVLAAVPSHFRGIVITRSCSNPECSLCYLCTDHAEKKESMCPGLLFTHKSKLPAHVMMQSSIFPEVNKSIFILC